MPDYIMFGDIVEGNGKTIRENNLAVPHRIPLKTLVEIHSDTYSPEYHGVRLWVVEHTRDCDGTPLYTLSYNRDHADTLDFENILDRMKTVGGFSEANLRVVGQRV